jgi:hypothetical protein
MIKSLQFGARADFSFSSRMVRTFQVVLQTSEITGAASIIALSKTLGSRSKLVRDELRLDQTSSAIEDLTVKVDNSLPEVASKEVTAKSNTPRGLPRYPLVDFDTAMEDLFVNVSPHAQNQEEREELRKAVDELLQPESTARNLYKQLRQRADDPNVDSWIADLLLQAVFLKRRGPLAPHQSFIGAHNDSALPHTQAERAAVIVSTALQFKQDLEAGKVEPDRFGEVELCTDTWDWIFNAVREPGSDLDIMQKYRGKEFIAVLRQGHVFKVPYVVDGGVATFGQLEATFQSIIDLDLSESWVSILTADERNSWAGVCHAFHFDTNCC